MAAEGSARGDEGTRQSVAYDSSSERSSPPANMPKNPIPAAFRYVAFYDLLADAAYQHRLTKGTTDSFRVSRHARASIVASAFSVECTANCLLDDMESPKALRDEIDKLQALAKIETALRIKGIKTFDRSRHEVQGAAELVRLRNDYVHPRTRTSDAEAYEPEDTDTEWRVPFSVQTALWPTLGIPKQSIVWSGDASIAVLKVLCSFLRYLFVDVLKAEQDHLDMLLVSRFQLGQVGMPVLFDEVRNEIAALREEGVDLSFLLTPLEPTGEGKA